MTIQRQRLNLKLTVADTDKIGSMARAGYTVPQIATVLSGGDPFNGHRGRWNVTEIDVERVLRELHLAPPYPARSA